MNDSVCSYNAVTLSKIRLSFEIGNTTTCFLNDEGTSHIVPTSYVFLHITVETTCGNVTEGHRSRSHHTHAGGTAIKGIDELMNDGTIGIAVVGQLQTEQGIGKCMGCHLKLTTIEPSSPTLPRIVTFAGGNLIDYTY